MWPERLCLTERIEYVTLVGNLRIRSIDLRRYMYSEFLYEARGSDSTSYYSRTKLKATDKTPIWELMCFFYWLMNRLGVIIFGFHKYNVKFE